MHGTNVKIIGVKIKRWCNIRLPSLLEDLASRTPYFRSLFKLWRNRPMLQRTSGLCPAGNPIRGTKRWMKKELKDNI